MSGDTGPEEFPSLCKGGGEIRRAGVFLCLFGGETPLIFLRKTDMITLHLPAWTGTASPGVPAGMEGDAGMRARGRSSPNLYANRVPAAAVLG